MTTTTTNPYTQTTRPEPKAGDVDPKRAVDVIIIGGGPAGLSAALCLGRSRRRVAVFDAGSPRHAVAEGVHNLISREGVAPAALRELTWAQMAAYPSVLGPLRQRVGAPRRAGDVWLLDDADGQTWRARALVLATGVIDEHPDIPGYAERWGHSVHPCPFCHGWEIRDQPVAVLGAGEGAVHMARLVRGWTDDVVLATHGERLTPEQQGVLAEAEIPVYTQPVARLDGEGRTLERVVWDDGGALARSAVFSVTAQRQVPLVAELGLALDDHGYVAVDPFMATSVPGVWAAGDMTSHLQQVVEAAAQGLRAGAMIQSTLTLGG